MSTVKLTELPVISHLDTNTSNTILIGVDLPSDVTGQFTIKTLSEGLYANNILNVGNNEIIFPGVIGQFVGNNESYLQINLENNNKNGSSDYVATADIGTDTIHYVDFGIAGSNNYSSGYSSIKPLDGYLYVQGNTGQPGGNLIIGTNSPQREVIISIGGMNSENVFAKFSTTQGFKLVEKPITFADGTTQNTSAVAGIESNSLYANAAYIKANSAFSSQNTTGIYANAAYSQANTATTGADLADSRAFSAGSYANAAYIKANSAFNSQNTTGTYANAAFSTANNALANTSGIFGGNLIISGNVTVSGQTSSTGPITTGNLIVSGTSNLTGNVVMNAATYMTGAVTVNSTMVIANSNFSATEAALTITASPTVATPSNDGYMIHISGKNGVPSRIVTDSYGTNSYVVFAGRAARGNVSYPSALQANDVIARFSSNGYGATKYQSLGVGRIDFVAAENFTDANTGSRIEFWNCSLGSNTLNKIASFNGDSVHFSGVVAPEKGFIFTPRILSAQTAITIDFANDSMIRSTYNSTLTMSFVNYTYGKVVEVWLTNTAGTGQTINLGVLANNSTTGSSTLSVASNRSAKLQYFSIDGDLANTFCAITYA